MLLGSLFVVIAIGILAFAVVTRPFSIHVPAKSGQEPDVAIEEYRRRVKWLDDLETSYLAGKIDEVDYLEQKKALEAEAEDWFRQSAQNSFDGNAEEEKRIEKLISGRRMQRKEHSLGFCPKCGHVLQSSDRFCPGCGSSVKRGS